MDKPLGSILPSRSEFVGGLLPESSLSGPEWEASIRDTWDGNFLVFTLPPIPEPSDGPPQAQLRGQIELTRLVKLLRRVPW